eukprot:s610_g6.t1
MRALKQEKKEKKPTRLLGRSFDLKSAYRQLAVRDDSLKWARLAVFCPATRCFQQYPLPFGAKASAVAFLRRARMIQWIAHRLEIAATCYFDDYVCLAPEVVANSSEKAFELLVDLLGWEFDKTGDKADQMSETVSALGVRFNLSQTGEGVFTVQNTEKRKADISAQIAEVLELGRMSASRAASLKGRLGFAEGQLFGHAIRRLVNELGRHAMYPPPRGRLLEETRRALELVGQRIVTAGPRRVEADTSEDIAHEIALLEEELSTLAWYARVPTEANLADFPSRWEGTAVICGADRPTLHPMDQQLVARLQALQRIVIFRQLVRFALLATDDVGDQIETHEFSNAHWRARLRPAVPTAIWSSQMKPGSAHCDLVLADEAAEVEKEEEKEAADGSDRI